MAEKEKEEPKASELKNEEVTVTINKKPYCTVELVTHALKPIMDKAKNKAFKDVRKGVDLPGFRKGKAPEDLIRKKYPNAIEEKTRDTVADFAFASAMKLAKISPLNQNSRISFNLDEFSPDEAKLTFTYETEPEVPAVDPKKFKMKEVERPETGEKELEESIKQMLLFYAKWTPITDRGVEEKDYIIIDLETQDEPKQKVFADTRFEVSDSHMAEWMKKLVLGKKAGDVLEGMSEPDKDASEKEKKEFEQKRVLLTIKKIETAEIPELNDEFAKKVGAEDVQKLKDYLQKMLDDKADEKVDKEKREAINRFLLEEYPFDLPLSLIESEKEHRKKQMEQDPNHKQKLSLMNEEQKEEMDRGLNKQSEEAVRLFYISRSIVRKEEIAVTEGEVQQEAIRTLNAFGPVNIDPKKIPNEVFALSLSKVILAKAQDFIMNNA